MTRIACDPIFTATLSEAGMRLPAPDMLHKAGISFSAQTSGIRCNVISGERGLDDASWDSRIPLMYTNQGYSKTPTTPEEAAALGLKSFNALQVSCPHFETGAAQAVLTLQPTRYLMLQAWKDLHKIENFSAEEAQAINPKIASVSLYCIAQHNGEYIQVSQIKGKALGSGEIHSAIAAGGINPDEMNAPDVITKAQLRELREETGLILPADRVSAGSLLIHEYYNGFLNVANFVRVDLDQVLAVYEAYAKRELTEARKLEALGVAVWHPIAQGLALTTLDGRHALSGFSEYVGTETGLARGYAERKLRPVTEGWLGYLNSDSSVVPKILELAGF